jgi:hypothetical protein
MPDGNLLFDTDPSFPALWILGLTGFLALWWYAVRYSPAQRLMFLVLWAPAALLAMLVYRYGRLGLSTIETLQLLADGDSQTLRDLVGPELHGPALTFGFVVGGSAAVCTTMASHLAGTVLGAAIGLFTGGGRSRSRPM